MTEKRFFEMEKRSLKPFLSLAFMLGVPGGAIMVPDSGFPCRAACPVVAGHVVAGRKCPAFRRRASQDVVPIRRKSAVRNQSALFVEHGHGLKAMGHTNQLVEILAHQNGVPRASADPGAHVDGIETLGAKARPSRPIGNRRYTCNLLAVSRRNGNVVKGSLDG